MFDPSEHAVVRYIERFEGNLTFERASERLKRLSERARFRRVLPGNARLYTQGSVNLVVSEDLILTVYRTVYRLTPVDAEPSWAA